jgi:hypothetical protein
MVLFFICLIDSGLKQPQFFEQFSKAIAFMSTNL